MTPKKKVPSIIGRAMLVHFHNGLWTARKYDSEVTAKVNSDMNADADAGRYRKRLFGGKKTTHSQLVTAGHQARQTHRSQTLPWEDGSWRLLPTANYYQYTESMRKARSDWEVAEEAFFAEYLSLVKQAPKLLGKMYRKADYPPLAAIKGKYHFSISFSPVPTSDDLRVSLPKAELAAVAKSVEQSVVQKIEDAMQDAWQRLGDLVVELRPKLDDGLYVQSTLTKLEAVAETLGRLNLTDDPRLEKARKRVLLDLTTLDSKSLKKDGKVRAAAAVKADAILKSMQSVYSPA